jgi:hypothetical protein
LKHWTAQDYIRNICEGSPCAGQVKTYKLSEEERQAIIAKYGPPKGKPGRVSNFDIKRKKDRSLR